MIQRLIVQFISVKVNHRRVSGTREECYTGSMFGDFTLFGIATLLVCLLVALTIHEFMHAYAGYLLGDDTAKMEGRLSLNPMQHIDPLMTVLLPIVSLVLFHVLFLAAKPVPFHPGRVRYGEFGAAIIAAAGPLSNLVLAFVGALALRMTGTDSTIGQIWNTFMLLNIGIFVFNIIPIPPLDGSRVLYAFSPDPLRRILEQIEPYGFMIILALVLLGGFGGWIGNLNQLVLSWMPL